MNDQLLLIFSSGPTINIHYTSFGYVKIIHFTFTRYIVQSSPDLTNIRTEVFGSNGFGNNGFSGITDILAIPKLKFYIKNVQSNGFPGITDKMASPN